MDSSKKTVGVVIPFYNGSKFIERALVSVFNQTIKADEIVVVNDGSSQEESLFLRKLEGKFPSRFKVIDQENQGQGGARNTGVDYLSCDYVCFLDQDDYYLPYHNEELIKSIPEFNDDLGFIYADLVIADIDGLVYLRSCVKKQGEHPKVDIGNLLAFDMFVLPSASLINIKAFKAVGGFDSQFTGYEDDDLFLRIFRAGFTNIFVEKSLTVWCQHKESTSHSIKMKRSRLRYFKKLLKNFPPDNDQNIFYVEKLIVPRFFKYMFSDLIFESNNPSDNYDEVRMILSEALSIFIKLPHRVRKTNLIIKLIIWLLNVPKIFILIKALRCSKSLHSYFFRYLF